jgi:hypothetical protein
MKRVLLLATTTGYQTRAFGEAAERLAVELVFATDRCHMIEDPWQDHAIPIRFHDEDASVSAIVEAAVDRPIDGLIAVGDRPTIGTRVATIRSSMAPAPGRVRRAPQATVGTSSRCRLTGPVVLSRDPRPSGISP